MKNACSSNRNKPSKWMLQNHPYLTTIMFLIFHCYSYGLVRFRHKDYLDNDLLSWYNNNNMVTVREQLWTRLKDILQELTARSKEWFHMWKANVWLTHPTPFMCRLCGSMSEPLSACWERRPFRWCCSQWLETKRWIRWFVKVWKKCEYNTAKCAGRWNKAHVVLH